MKDHIYSILIWFSGADRNTLDACTKSEHIKYGGYGVLILIPAVIGVISMSYAISTLTSDSFISLGMGFGWGIIVLFIDRFIVSTLKKGDNIWRDLRSIAFILRFIFALGIGIIVSHPLVMFFFDGSIKQHIANEKRSSVIKNFTSISLIKDSENSELNKKISQRDCLAKLLTAEQSGIVDTLDCGYSSGIKECGERCRNIRDQITTLNSEIKNLETKITPNITKLDSISDFNEKDISSNFSDDYIARVEVMEKLENESSQIKVVKWFLILFFVFLDILPVTFKVVTKIGEYDLRIKESEKKISVIERQTNRDIEVEVGLIERLTNLKNEKIDLIFAKNRNGTINDIIKEIAYVLNLEDSNAEKGFQSQNYTIVNRKGFYKMLDNEIVKIAFIILILTLEYYILDYYLMPNKDKWAVILPLVITTTLPLLQQIVPTKSQQKN